MSKLIACVYVFALELRDNLCLHYSTIYLLCQSLSFRRILYNSILTFTGLLSMCRNGVYTTLFSDVFFQNNVSLNKQWSRFWQLLIVSSTQTWLLMSTMIWLIWVLQTSYSWENTVERFYGWSNFYRHLLSGDLFHT